MNAGSGCSYVLVAKLRAVFLEINEGLFPFNLPNFYIAVVTIAFLGVQKIYGHYVISMVTQTCCEILYDFGINIW